MTAQNEQCLDEATEQQWLETPGDEKASREAGSMTQRSGTRLQDATGWKENLGQVGSDWLQPIA